MRGVLLHCCLSAPARCLLPIFTYMHMQMHMHMHMHMYRYMYTYMHVYMYVFSLFCARPLTRFPQMLGREASLAPEEKQKLKAAFGPDASAGKILKDADGTLVSILVEEVEQGGLCKKPQHCRDCRVPDLFRGHRTCFA